MRRISIWWTNLRRRLVGPAASAVLAATAVAIGVAGLLLAGRGEMDGSAAAEVRERAALAEPEPGASPARRQAAGSARDPGGGESPSAMSDLPVPPSGAGTEPEPLRWRSSQALGTPVDGRLVRGVQLPSEGSLFYTWDPIRRTSPNRGWRRFGADRLVRTVLRVLADFKKDNPQAPRVGIGDLSRPRGGDFGPRFGAPGHASHQNGLDVDIYYPRKDRREREPLSPRQIDRPLAQDLVERFVRAGARFVFIGPRSGLTGPPRVVQAIPHHDNHLHVRLPAS